MKPMLKKIKLNYFHVFFVYFISFIVLWGLPFLFGKYADTTFPYVNDEDIIDELVGLIGPADDKLPWCPREPPNIAPGFQINGYAIDLIKEDDSVFAEKLNILPGGVWQPSQCRSRYQVSIILSLKLQILGIFFNGKVYQVKGFLKLFIYLQVVVIVPYRDRNDQLQIFLQYMHQFLQRQQLYYR